MYLSFKLAEEKGVFHSHLLFNLLEARKKGVGENQKNTKSEKHWVGQKVHSGITVRS